jgi:hypothetical protein
MTPVRRSEFGICTAMDTTYAVMAGSRVLIYKDGDKDNPVVDCPYEHLILQDDVPDGEYRICVTYRDVMNVDIIDAKCWLTANPRASWLSVDCDRGRLLAEQKPFEERVEEFRKRGVSIDFREAEAILRVNNMNILEAKAKLQKFFDASRERKKYWCMWSEDDATPGTDGHEGLGAAWERLFATPQPAEKDALAVDDVGDGVWLLLEDDVVVFASMPGQSAIYKMVKGSE